MNIITIIRKLILKEKIAREKEEAAWKMLINVRSVRAEIDEDLKNYKINTDYLQELTERLAKMKTDLEGMKGETYDKQREDIDATNAEINAIDQRNKALMNGEKNAQGQWVIPSIALRQQSVVYTTNEANKMLYEAKKIRQAKI